MDVSHILTLDSPYVQHTFFAFASLFLGLLGIVLGARLASNGKVSAVIWLGIGIGTMTLLATPYGYLAPGWCAVALVSFLLSGQFTRLVTGLQGSGGAAAPKKDAAPKNVAPPKDPPKTS